MRNPDVEPNTFAFGFARDVIGLLVRTGDPRAVATMVDVAAGFGGKANLSVRRAAVDALAQLTRRRFVRSDPGQGESMYAVGDLTPLPTPDPFADAAAQGAHLTAVADRYRAWLAGEGRDPARWPALSDARARAELSSDRPGEFDDAVAFFRGLAEAGQDASPPHDLHPDDTFAVLVRRLSGTQIDARADPPTYTEQGQPAGYDAARAYAAVCDYGPAARPVAATLLRLLPPDDYFGGLDELTQVGGSEVVRALADRLPALAAAVARHHADARADLSTLSDSSARWAVQTYQACRYGIERWAGRRFDSDAAVAAWWAADHARSQEQWLSDGLEPTAARADGGDAEAVYLARQLLPDLPPAEGERRSWPPGSIGHDPQPTRPVATFRVAWLRQHRAALRYDEQRGAFLLPTLSATRPG